MSSSSLMMMMMMMIKLMMHHCLERVVVRYLPAWVLVSHGRWNENEAVVKVERLEPTITFRLSHFLFPNAYKKDHFPKTCSGEVAYGYCPRRIS
eukprot:CCRYP_015696-RA/>CCRYP_015696-RA protein AED:0.39 eAED:0.39 QI:15/1/1/1/0/0/2/327/93